MCLAGGANVDVTEISARIRQTRGKRAVLTYHLRDCALANGALVRQDFEAFVIEKAECAETAAVRGDSRALYSIVTELGARKRAGSKKVILEDWSVAQGLCGRGRRVLQRDARCVVGVRPERCGAPGSSSKSLALTQCWVKSSGTNYKQSPQQQK